jgi:hypothetical protein
MVTIKKNGDGKIDKDISLADIIKMGTMIGVMVLTYMLTISEIKTTQQLQAQIIDQHDTKIKKMDAHGLSLDDQINDLDKKIDVHIAKSKK